MADFKLLNYAGVAGEARPGILVGDDQIVDLEQATGGEGWARTNIDVLNNWETSCSALHAIADNPGETRPLADVQLRAPLLFPPAISSSSGAHAAFINVGRAGSNTNTLNVSGASTISITNSGGGSAGMSVGRNGSIGVVNLDRAGSSIPLQDFLNVGRDSGGDGTINVGNGAVLSNTAGSGMTRVGRSGGVGEINVRTGSTFNSNNLRLGNDTGSQGTVNVNGGSTVAVTEFLQVGRESAGTLNIGDDLSTGTVENSGTVNAQTGIVGHDTGSNGVLNVNGASASLNLSSLDTSGNGAVLLVGRVGTGTANVTNGGTVSVSSGAVPTGLDGGLLVGGSASNPATTGNGTLNVDGAGSTVTLSDGFTQVGRQGIGSLNITNGGVLDASAQTAAVVGRKTGSTGTVNINGVGSTWFAAADLFVGTDASLGTATPTGPGGTGFVSVGNGGTLTATNVYIGASGTLTGSGGTINGDVTVDGGLFAPGASPGTMTINGDLNISTGVLQLETEGGIADNIIVSGNVNIGGDVVLELYFDNIPAVIDIADFFGASDPVFGAGFDASDIMVFTSVVGNVGLSIDVTFGGTTQSFSADFGTTVSEPSTLIIFAFGVAGAMLRRRKRI